jgi:hypothetical protein
MEYHGFSWSAMESTGKILLIPQILAPIASTAARRVAVARMSFPGKRRVTIAAAPALRRCPLCAAEFRVVFASP